MYDPMLDLIRMAAGLISIIGSVIVMQGAKAKISSGQSSQDPLTKDERIKVWILAILNPVLTGAILYFGLRKRLPIKARNSNTISFAAVGIWIILWFVLALISSK